MDVDLTADDRPPASPRAAGPETELWRDVQLQLGLLERSVATLARSVREIERSVGAVRLDMADLADQVRTVEAGVAQSSRTGGRIEKSLANLPSRRLLRKVRALVSR